MDTVTKGQNRTESPTAIWVWSWQATVYKLLAPDYYERHHRNNPEKLYSIATACPSCSWPHIHMVARPQQLLPICHYECGSHAHTIRPTTLFLSGTHHEMFGGDVYQWKIPPQNICVSFLVARPSNCNYCSMRFTLLLYSVILYEVRHYGC